MQVCGLTCGVVWSEQEPGPTLWGVLAANTAAPRLTWQVKEEGGRGCLSSGARRVETRRHTHLLKTEGMGVGGEGRAYQLSHTRTRLNSRFLSFEICINM